MRFFEALELFGKDFHKITEHVGTKSIESIRGHCAYQQRRHSMHPDLPNAARIVEILTTPLRRGRYRKQASENEQQPVMINTTCSNNSPSSDSA